MQDPSTALPAPLVLMDKMVPLVPMAKTVPPAHPALMAKMVSTALPAQRALLAPAYPQQP